MSQVVRLTASLLFFIVSAAAVSQKRDIDSLRQTWQNSKEHDTTKLMSIVTTMSTKYNDSDKRYHHLNHFLGRLAWEHLQKKQSPKLYEKYVQFLAYYYATLSVEAKQDGEIGKSLAAIDKAIALNRSVKLEQDVHFAMIDKARLYIYIKDYEKAIRYAFAGLKYFEAHPENVGDNGIIMANSALAEIYTSQGKLEKALQRHQKVTAVFLAKKEYYAQNDYYLAMNYADCGSIYYQLGQYSQALDYFHKALALTQKIKDSKWTSIISSRMTSVWIAQSEFEKARQMLDKALAMSTDDLAVATAYEKLGELYYFTRDFKKADAYLTKALAMSKKLKNLELQEAIAATLYKTNVADKNFEKALKTHLFQVQLADSSKTEASKNKLEQQELQYSFEKKELNLKLAAEKENAIKDNWLIGLSGALLLFASGGVFYYRNNKQKQAIAGLEKNQIKQKLLITQMNPHFIFNSVHNIRNLIDNHQNADAVRYLDQFAVLTRQILEHSNENYISLEEEVAMIQNYLSIQQLLYNHKFQFNVVVSPDIETDSTFLPPMLTQPFIENAIKHGLGSKSANGLVDIRFFLDNCKLFFEVTDNGKGFDSSKTLSNHKSLAMTITKERLVSYTKNQDFTVQTDNIKDQEQNIVGAKVRFEIPYIYEN